MWKMYVLRSDIHCVKYAKMGLLWSVFSHLRFCPYMEKYGYNSVDIRENKDQKKSAFQHIFRSDQEEKTVWN